MHMEKADLGQRQTRQRDTILSVIRGAAGPLTIAEILARGQEEVPGLGIATVYRTVKLLQDAGIIQQVLLPSGEVRFEPVDRGHHHHFQCRLCAIVIDLDVCHVQIPRNSLPEGFEIEGHELTLFGTCPVCTD
jgi:Fur family transcriptional regulator, ferric uptake regulator